MTLSNPPKKSNADTEIFHIGLTGNIASGKSKVAEILGNVYGLPIIDADALAQQATSDPAVLTEIAAQLSPTLIVNGMLDRAATAARIFADDTARQKLNAIVHPWVAHKRQGIVAKLMQELPPPRCIVHDIPLLYETGLGERFDMVMVVVAPLDVRIARASQYRGMAATDVRARDASQMSQQEKAARADIVIDNGGTLEGLQSHVAHAWRQLPCGKHCDETKNSDETKHGNETKDGKTKERR